MRATLSGAFRDAAVATALAVALFLTFGLSGCATYQQRAQSELAEGDYQSAATDVQAALAANPDNSQLKDMAADIFTRRGHMNFEHGDLFAAQADLYRALHYRPAYIPACLYMGQLDYKQGKYVDAIRWGEMATGAFGANEPPYVAKARAALAASNSMQVTPAGNVASAQSASAAAVNAGN